MCEGPVQFRALSGTFELPLCFPESDLQHLAVEAPTLRGEDLKLQSSLCISISFQEEA